MCTVSFLPLGNEGYILTSNRDEWSGRKPALPPRRHRINHKYVFFPKDQEAGGTWIATCEYYHTLCLLNGAFEPHERKLPYRMSRGKMLLEFYNFDGLDDFIQNYNFSGIEPFTLIVVNGLNGLQLDELRWDGDVLFHTPKSNSEPHIWSSATLYTPQVVQQRQNWFDGWLENREIYTQEDILSFHRFTGEGDKQTSLVMELPNGVLTQSITSVLKNQDNYRMSYLDMLVDKTYNYRILQSERSEN